MSRLIGVLFLLTASGLLPARGDAGPSLAAGPGYSSFTAYSRAGNPAAGISGIQAFDYDDEGALYVMVENRYLIKNPAWSAQTLYDLGATPWTFPSFVRVCGGRVYFGESYNFQRIFSVSTDGEEGPSAPLNGNYDCAVNSQSQVFLSAAWATGTDDFSGNKICYWDEETLPAIVAVVGGNSGPIAFDRSDNLYYGRSTQYPPGPEDVVYYTASQLAGAIATGVPLTSADWQVFAGGADSPAAFASDGEADPSLFSTSGLQTVSRLRAGDISERVAGMSWPTFAAFSSAPASFSPFLPGGGRLSILGTDYPPLPTGGNPRSREFLLALVRAGKTADVDYGSAVFAIEPCPQNFILGSSDFSGDGASEAAVFRPASGLWAVRGLSRFSFGTAGDLPVGGDYSGNGTAEAAIFRPTSGLWAVRQSSRFGFGNSGDIPLPRDYTGGGKAVAAVFTPATGLWAIRELTRFTFGEAGDFPLPGDWDGDGTAGAAVFRPADGLWVVREISRFYFGGAGDLPVPGNYGNGAAWEAAVYRPADGRWAVRNLTVFYLGREGDLPVPADFDGDGTTIASVRRPADGRWAVRGATRFYLGAIDDYPMAR